MFLTNNDFNDESLHKKWTYAFFKGFHVNEANTLKTLNCSYGKNESDAIVEKNRLYVANAHRTVFGYQIIPYQFLKQTHSNCVHTIDRVLKTIPIGDGLVTNAAGLMLCLQTADCMPILFYDPHAHVIGACHAGWRGLARGVIENTLLAMEKLGARTGAMKVIIGPCICQESYEVNQDLSSVFKDYADFIKPNGNKETLLLDLPGIACTILKNAGVQKIIPSCVNTYTNPAFFSYRRSYHQGKPHEGNQLSIIGLLNDE